MGLGMCMGPVMSGILYQYINYLGIFVLLSFILLFGGIYAIIVLPSSLNQAKKEPVTNLQDSTYGSMEITGGSRVEMKPIKYSYTFFVANFDLLTLLFILCLMNMTIFSFENILSVYLTDTLLMNVDYIGYIFGVRAGAYAIMSLITPRLCKVFRKRSIINVGLVLIGVANALMGSSKYFSLP